MNLSDLKRVAEHADKVAGNPRTRLTDVHLRIRTRRRQHAITTAGVLVVALALTGAVVGRSFFADRTVAPAGPTPTSGVVSLPAGAWCAAMPLGAPDPGPVGFVGLPPVGAVSSSTESADLVLQYYGAAGHGGRSRLWLFNDGRLIVLPNGRIPSGPAAGTEGYVERCLSPSGVAKMHAYVLTTAPNSVDAHPVPTLRVRVGASLVDFAPGRMDPDHLFEPETWLQDVDFIDAHYRPYVPTTYSFCSTPSSTANAASPVLDKLPSHAVEVLGTRPWSVRKVPTPAVSCATITADEARELVGIIDEAWFQQDYDGPPFVLDVGLHRRETQNLALSWDIATYVGIEPVMPDGQFTCNCG